MDPVENHSTNPEEQVHTSHPEVPPNFILCQSHVEDNSSVSQVISDEQILQMQSTETCFYEEPNPSYHARSPSLVYLKPCFRTPRHSIYDHNDELYQLYYDESYPAVVPFSLVDENGVCYAALPHGRTIDLSSLYYKGNGSPSMLDLHETQSPKEKRIARVVMAVAVILLTMCVVLVGVTLSMSGYIDSMVWEQHSKRSVNPAHRSDSTTISRIHNSTLNGSMTFSFDNVTGSLDVHRQR